MDWPKTRKVALLIGALSMIITPVLAEATSLPQLNHYSDYGLVEQGQTTGTNTLSISNDPFGYSDEYTDSESGLQYLQVRYYDPAIMRFTQMDTYPLLNRYAYANENPIMNDDPSGHYAVGAEQSGSRESKSSAIVGVSLGAIASILAIGPVALYGVTALAIGVTNISGLLTLVSGTSAVITSAATVTTGVASLDTHLSVKSQHSLMKASQILDFTQMGISIAVLGIDAYSFNINNSNGFQTLLTRAERDEDFFLNAANSSTGTYLAMRSSPVWGTLSSIAYGTYAGVESTDHLSTSSQNQKDTNESNPNENNINNTMPSYTSTEQQGINQTPQAPFQHLIHHPFMKQQDAQEKH